MKDAPWRTPRPGDACVNAAGRTRKVVQVSYANWSGRHFPTHEPGTYLALVVYELNGAQRTCAGVTWAAWCATTVREGGSYESAPEMAR